MLLPFVYRATTYTDDISNWCWKMLQLLGVLLLAACAACGVVS